MNYLNAIKKTAASHNSPIEPHIKSINNEVVLTNDENYLKNVEDSFISDLLPELIDMCNFFVEESLNMKNPILMKHHYGQTNFVSEIMNLFQENAYVNIIEQEEEESELEDELDPIDIYNVIPNDKF
uniref:Uncharacterized protein n=1 Tax=viral metagenome TaxID=1070528 RepID=A0A6C0L305_9ZZZZ|tara:strand:- start:7766 stop:8146 length:381 start_codon:yes stop_codon:yes gene_type:complete